MHVLSIVTSPRKDQSASRGLVDAFLREYMTRANDIVVDTLDVWQEWLEFDAETINAKYKGVSGEPMTPTEVRLGENPRARAALPDGGSHCHGGADAELLLPYKLKQLIVSASQGVYIEFWLWFIGVRQVVTLTLEHT